MYLRAVTVVFALPMPALMCGCGGSDHICFVEDEFPCCALVLEVPDSINAAETIDAFVSGYAGTGCDRFDRIEREMIAGKWILRPIARRGRPPMGSVCNRGMVHFQHTVTLAAPDIGWVHIEVQSSCPALLDSTYVRPEPGRR